MRYIKSDRSHQPFAKLIAGNVKKIVEIYEGNEQGDEKDNLVCFSSFVTWRISPDKLCFATERLRNTSLNELKSS